MSDYVIGVVGNPNCGKTTLFNALTGARQRVGNWPGVTVERKTGEYRHQGKTVQLVDLPGIYSLSATSLDEELARDYILSNDAVLIVNIVDASNLERNLYLTVQLLEMNIPMVVALNMMDVAGKRGMKIDVAALSERLSCPVVPLVACRGEGTEVLKSTINQAAEAKPVSNVSVLYPPEIQSAVESLLPAIHAAAAKRNIEPRWAALKLLEGDEVIARLLGNGHQKLVQRHVRAIEEKLGDDPDILVADSRYGLIRRLTKETVEKPGRLTRGSSDKIDRVVLNRLLGIPIFLVAMYVMFLITVNFGGAFIDFFDILAGTVFVDGFKHLLAALGSPDWLIAIFAGGIGGGIQTIATFIPPIGLMFICLSFLEDSGYMARAAFVMDRFMRVIGLPGKAFVPMLVGFGCNVPAVMATRTLESERDRTLTVMMNPFMSCGARLPVYALFAAAFFPVGGQNLVFALYLIGIGFAVLTGFILKHTLLKGEITPFVMELPAYHLPTFRGVLFRSWDRLKTFVFRAGRVIIPVVIVLSFLSSMGTDGTFGNEDTDKSVLSSIGQAITPVFAPLGVKEENWPATVGIFTGIFAKEAVVGTLNSLYGQMGMEASDEAGEGERFDFLGGIKEAFVSIPDNLAGLGGAFLDPLGISVGDVENLETAAEEQEVSVGVFGAMVKLFDGRVGAFAYLIFILLYFPCVAAIAAVYRETNFKWAAFSGGWTTALAYTSSTVFYQLATIGRHPLQSTVWILSLLSLFVVAVLVLRQMGQSGPRSGQSIWGAAGA